MELRAERDKDTAAAASPSPLPRLRGSRKSVRQQQPETGRHTVAGRRPERRRARAPKPTGSGPPERASNLGRKATTSHLISILHLRSARPPPATVSSPVPAASTAATSCSDSLHLLAACPSGIQSCLRFKFPSFCLMRDTSLLLDSVLCYIPRSSILTTLTPSPAAQPLPPLGPQRVSALTVTATWGLS